MALAMSCLIALAMSCLIALVGVRAEAQTRLALVIGNGGCSSAPLANARNDARLVVAAQTNARSNNWRARLPGVSKWRVRMPRRRFITPGMACRSTGAIIRSR
jgi:shikimate 5-dehydrogenase